MDHARSKRWRGRLENPNHQGRVRNPLCGDEVELTLLTESNLIRDIRFEGRGCFLSQAGASCLCETIVGERLSELKQRTPSELLGFDVSSFSTNRQRCAHLAVEALQQILAPRSNSTS